MKIAVLDDNTVLVGCSNQAEAQYMRDRLATASYAVAPWRFFVIPFEPQFYDLRNDPTLTAQVDEVQRRLDEAVETKEQPSVEPV